MFVLVGVFNKSFAGNNLLTHVTFLMSFLVNFIVHLLDLILLFKILDLFLQSLVTLILFVLTIGLEEISLTLVSYFESPLAFSIIKYHIFKLLFKLRLYRFGDTRHQPLVELFMFMIADQPSFLFLDDIYVFPFQLLFIKHVFTHFLIFDFWTVQNIFEHFSGTLEILVEFLGFETVLDLELYKVKVTFKSILQYFIQLVFLFQIAELALCNIHGITFSQTMFFMDNLVIELACLIILAHRVFHIDSNVMLDFPFLIDLLLEETNCNVFLAHIFEHFILLLRHYIVLLLCDFFLKMAHISHIHLVLFRTLHFLLVILVFG